MASLRLSFPRMEAASSHCLRLVGYSLPFRWCFTLELVMSITSLGSARGTGVASIDLRQCTYIQYIQKCWENDKKKTKTGYANKWMYVNMLWRMYILYKTLKHYSLWKMPIAYLQSISKAWPALPRTETNWSIMPQGTSAWVCSACWHATALDISSLSSV